MFFERTDAKAPILWPPHAKSWFIGKDFDVGRDWGKEEKGMTEDEMAGWHHWLDGHEFGWTPGVGDGQGGLACCNSWGHKESDTTEWLNWTELMSSFLLGIYLEVKMLGHRVILCLTFWRTAFQVVVPFHILISNVWAFQFHHIFAKNCCYCSILNYSPLSKHAVVFHYSFDFNFTIANVRHICVCVCVCVCVCLPSVCLPWRNLCSFPHFN